MSEWKKVKLKDCCIKIGSGSTPQGGSTVYIDSGTSLIRSQNVYNLSFDYNGLTHITEDAAKKLNGVTILKNDILLNITGDSVARTCIVPDNVLPARVNQHVAIVRVDDKTMNSNYLNYYLASPKMQARMLSLAVGKGASRNAMTKQMIENFEVPCPPIETQIRIATILSRYDSLIENYQKQIKLLEESAQRLYKEWFIDLRFPGHENTKIVDGVPEGWEKKCVDSIYSIKYGKNLSTKLIEEKGDYPVYGANGVIGYYSEANCNEQVVLITSRGNGSGDVLMTYHKEAFITNNSFIVTPLEEYLYCQLPFTYQFLKCANFRNVRTGAAQPQLTNQSIHTIDVILPTKDVIVEFCKKTDSNNSLIINLKKDIHHLTEARDRLLPKLMSGEIEV